MMETRDLICFNNEDIAGPTSDSTSIWSNCSKNDAMSENSTTELSTLDEISSMFDPLARNNTINNDISSEDELKHIFDARTVNIDDVLLEITETPQEPTDLFTSALQQARIMLQDDFLNSQLPGTSTICERMTHVRTESFINTCEDMFQIPRRNESQESRLTNRTNETTNTTGTVVYFKDPKVHEEDTEKESICSGVDSEITDGGQLVVEEEMTESKLPPITSRLWKLWVSANKKKPDLVKQGLGVISVFSEFENHLLSQIRESDSYSTQPLSHVSSQFSIESDVQRSPLAWDIPLWDESSPQMSLQEAFELHRSSFVKSSRGRQKMLKETIKLRQNDSNEGNQRKSSNKYPNVTCPLNPGKRKRMSMTEIRAQNEKIYKRLPEVVKKKEDQERQEYYSKNRLQRQLYNQKILAELFEKGSRYNPRRHKYIVMKNNGLVRT